MDFADHRAPPRRSASFTEIERALVHANPKMVTARCAARGGGSGVTHRLCVVRACRLRVTSAVATSPRYRGTAALGREAATAKERT